MKCPFCKKEDLKVIDTRKFDTVVIRIRFCYDCQKGFRTYEEKKEQPEPIFYKKRKEEEVIPPIGRFAPLTVEHKEESNGELEIVGEPENLLIYFIKSSNGMIKIGATTNVTERLEQIRSMSPCEISLLRTITGTFREEKQIHKKFQHLRKHGEWFVENDELTCYIKSLPEYDS